MCKSQCFSSFLFLGALLLALFATCSADVVKFDSCLSNNDTIACQVHEVRIDPCPEAAEDQPCRFKRGHPANIQFDFTTGHSAPNVTGQAYWATAAEDLPLVGMERNACLFTPCPVEENVRSLYNQTITISRKFPPRNYEIKWKVWAEDKFQCCFTTKIKLLK